MLTDGDDALHPRPRCHTPESGVIEDGGKQSANVRVVIDHNRHPRPARRSLPHFAPNRRCPQSRHYRPGLRERLPRTVPSSRMYSVNPPPPVRVTAATFMRAPDKNNTLPSTTPPRSSIGAETSGRTNLVDETLRMDVDNARSR